MKKILCLLSFMVVFSTSIASAEIVKGTDSFTNGISIYSGIEISDAFLDRICLEKTIYDGILEYEMLIGCVQGEDFILKDKPIEIKIDEFPIYILDRYTYKKNQMLDNRYLYNSIIKTKVPLDIINKIRNSKRVAIRYENMLYQEVYVFPDEVLTEWKQVIATEK